MSNLFAAGDRVLFIDTKERRYLVTLEDTGEFHSHAGFVPDKSVIGSQEGITVESTKGAKYVVMRPTLEDFVATLERPRRILMMVKAGQPIDDLIATGGTALAAVSLLRSVGAEVIGAGFVIDLPDLGGSAALRNAGIHAHSLVEFPGH